MPRNEDFLRELRATFRIEAAEHLRAMDEGLERLAGLPDAQERAPHVESIFRAAHSLKGAARAADFGDIESLCQSLETLFSAWKRGLSAPTAATLDTARLTLDRMNAALSVGARRAMTAGTVRPLVRSRARVKDFEHLPVDEDLATTPLGRSLMQIRSAPSAIGMPYAVRPGVPAGRVTGHASRADADSPRLGGCSRPHERGRRRRGRTLGIRVQHWVTGRGAGHPYLLKRHDGRCQPGASNRQARRGMLQSPSGVDRVGREPVAPWLLRLMRTGRALW